MADWGILGLGGDPAPGDPPAVGAAAQRWAADAEAAARSVARLRGASGAADGIGMVGDYAPVFREALSGLPGELSAVERSYRRCGQALATYAGSLDHAQSLAHTALRRGADAQCTYDGELHRIRTVLPPTHALDLTPRGLAAPAVEAATLGLDEGLRGQIRAAAGRARQAAAEKDAARRLALQAAAVRGDAETRAVRDLDDAAEGVRNASFWQQAWDVVSSPFRSWDGFVDTCGRLAVVLSIAALFFGGPVVWALFAVSAVLAAATAVKFAQHRASVGELAWSLVGVIPGGAVMGRARLLLAARPVARFVAPLRRLQAVNRAGVGRLWGSVRRGAVTTLSTLRRTVTKDPIDLASGEVVLTQVDLSLPGALPLVLARTHISSYRSGRWFGPNWASSLDEHLEIDSGAVHLARADGSVLTFPLPSGGEVSRPAAGEQLELTRTEGGYVVTDPQTGVATWFRQLAGSDAVLTAIVDRNGHRIDVDYGRDGQLLALRHSGGYHVVLDTAEERVRGISLLTAGGALTPVVSFGYDEAGRLAAVVNSSGLPLRFDYDGAGRMTRWEDRNGNWYAYSYDEQGRCVRGSGIGGVLDCTLEFDPENRRTTYTDSLGQVTSYRVNEAGRVVSVTDPLGGVELTEWDAFDHVVAHTDALGATTRYDYAPDGVDLVGVRRADGARVRITYDTHRPVDVVEADGSVWRYRRDGRGNPIEVIDPAGASTQYVRRGDGCVVAVVDPLGHRVEIGSDAAGLPVSIDDAVGGRTVLRRDGFGRVISVEGPAGAVQAATYTAEGWLTTLRLPTGEVESWVHDGEGNVVQHRDGAGRVTRTEYGWFDQPSAVIRPDGSRLGVRHDSELRLTAVVDPLGREWTYAYDAAGRMVRERDVNGRELRYRRDAVGRVVARINPLGQQVGYRWDVLGRLTVKDVAGVRTEFGYDLLGRLVSSTGPDVALTIERDALGRVVAESWDGRRIGFGYDAAGRRIARLTPSGATAAWSFDAAGRPVELSTAGRRVSFGHDVAGREVERRVGAVRLGQEWNAAGQLVAQSLGSGPAEAAEPAALREFRYEGGARLVGVADRLRGLREFTLDLLDRVVAVAAEAGREEYAYDAAGTLAFGQWSGLPDGVSPGGERRVVGTMIRRAGGVRCHHDRAGRVTTRRVAGAAGEDRVWRYTWDAEDRLIAVLDPDGVTWRYRYDGLGRRVAKQRLAPDGVTVIAEETFVWDGVRLAERVASDGHVTTWDWHPDRHQPVTQVHRELGGGRPSWDVGGSAADEQEWFDAQFYAIVTDLIGTPTELVDDAGQVVWHSRTTLWGAAVDDEPEPLCPLRFPGQYRDAETGLDYNLQRYYDPRVGAFLSPDPLGLQPGPNPHSYVPNPTTWSDPLGLTPCLETYYRTMSPAHYEQLVATGRLPGTKETFISSSRIYVEKYDGILVEFSTRSGTMDSLATIGVRDRSPKLAERFPEMPFVSKGWTTISVYFKNEIEWMNIGLGRGPGLDIFSESIIQVLRLR